MFDDGDRRQQLLTKASSRAVTEWVLLPRNLPPFVTFGAALLAKTAPKLLHFTTDLHIRTSLSHFSIATYSIIKRIDRSSRIINAISMAGGEHAHDGVDTPEPIEKSIATLQELK